MIYLHPLAYLLGVEGAALLRGFREGFADREFVEARLAEVRALLQDPRLAEAEGVLAHTGGFSVREEYAIWAASYDEPNTMIQMEEPPVRAILAELPVGAALDAACGTGRYAAHLQQLGHRVIGVDVSREMLTVARRRLPDVDLREGTLDRLPLDDSSVDAVVCALALSYVKDLRPVLAEFARVLRPGGHLVISDAHVVLSYIRPMLVRHPGPDGVATVLREYHRPLSAYLEAALPLGFEVRGCLEPTRPSDEGSAAKRPVPDPDQLPTQVSWELLDWCPDATAALFVGSPAVVIWHFQLS